MVSREETQKNAVNNAESCECVRIEYVTTFIVFNSNVVSTFLSRIKLNDDVFRLQRYTLYACIYRHEKRKKRE